LKQGAFRLSFARLATGSEAETIPVTPALSHTSAAVSCHYLQTLAAKLVFLQAEPALMYDSVQVFAVGLRTLEQSHALRPANISCELEHPWDGGLSLTNYINSVSS